jgi:phosphoribosylformylglycinamidine cyclo-ligase
MLLTPIHYKDAGVDIDKTNATLNNLKPEIEATFSKAVLNPLGGYAALYDLKLLFQNYKEPVLVQSVDGLGTKTIIARLMNQYHSLGHDLVSATANDILVYGAIPLTLLNYIATDQINSAALSQLIKGITQACQQFNIALVGGETAEMPGIYHRDEHDVVGMITGVVEKEQIITGQAITPGDSVFAFTSSGLHTNGYSLARHLLFEQQQWSVDSTPEELDKPLGELLLEPHINYTKPILSLLENQLPIKGMAHITGGGLLDNLPRILPHHCAVEIKKNSWPQQALFALLQKLGGIGDYEMYRTFNMGIGYIIIGEMNLLTKANLVLSQAYPDYKLYQIGQVIPGTKEIQLCE